MGGEQDHDVIMSEQHHHEDSSDTDDDDNVDIADDMTGIINNNNNSASATTATNTSIVDMLSTSGNILFSQQSSQQQQQITSTTNNNTNMQTSSSTNNNTAQPISTTTMKQTENPESEKRREIQAILRDNTLSNAEKNICIQKLMDGRKKKKEPTPSFNNNRRCIRARNNSMNTSATALTAALSSNDISTIVSSINCVHYERKCVVVAPCCGKIYGCRVCHDESVSNYNNSTGITVIPGAGGSSSSNHMNDDNHVCNKNMDRYAIREIICKECHTRQPCSNKCIHCGIQFAEYHCPKCNIWMSNSKRPFHCDQCGFCRVGGREAFKHCNTCCMCISITVYDTHNCMKDKYKNNCPVCTEDMFSSRQAPQDLPCGHAIHAHCFRKLAGFDYRCPVCKKTVVSRTSMAAAWNARARDIAMQPMPPDLARRVCIMCNDCEVRSDDCSFHFLGVQCPKCDSFNTQQLSSTSAVIDMDDESSDRSGEENNNRNSGGNESNNNDDDGGGAGAGAGAGGGSASGQGNNGNGNSRPQFSDMAPNT